MKHILSCYVSNGMIRAKIEENIQSLSVTNATDFEKHFPGLDLRFQPLKLDMY